MSTVSAFRMNLFHEISIARRLSGYGGRQGRLHGHNLGITLGVVRDDAGSLDSLGRVAGLPVVRNRLCRWLDDEWHYRTLLWVHDPILERLRDIDDSIIALPCNPTAENLARYLVEVVGYREFAGTGLRLASCTVQETTDCSATYG
jgi:6-pyruvoyltetrahydropterin/6-carboxytetrahydropterin synthase